MAPTLFAPKNPQESMQNWLIQLRALVAAFQAQQTAIAAGGTTAEMLRFGRMLALKLLLRRGPAARETLLTPLLSTRIYELPFAWSCLQRHYLPGQGALLDISSPRLLSLFAAARLPDCAVYILNPDQQDATLTAQIASAAGYTNVTCAPLAVDALLQDSPQLPASIQCICAVSVIEHIWTDSYDDRDAVRWMYDRLQPGGCLILTVPVDRTYALEYREQDTYGLQSATERGYFFQRFYDQAAIQTRITDSIGVPPTLTRWYGEHQTGYFARHIDEWRRRGLSAAVTHPRDMLAHFQEYASWEQMPGVGVCGLMFIKPGTG